MASKERQHPRVQSDFQVNVRYQNGNVVTGGRIRNISLGGVFIEMEALSFGDELNLEFSLPGETKTIVCRGYVVWSTKTAPNRAGGIRGNGVRLTDISVAQMRLLANFIQKELQAGD